MIAKLGSFTLKTQAYFGRGAIESLGELATEMGSKTCLLIADSALEASGGLAAAQQSLKKSGIEFRIFDEIEPEPYLDGAEKAADLGKEISADLVVGMGGGSAMDSAKAAAVLITNGGQAQDYVGLNLVPAPGIPTLMIPTTAGTGAEVTFTAVFTNRETKAKGGINSVHLFPDKALLDPELTISLPPGPTAATGMDALTHAIESYTSRSSTVFTEAFSLTAIRLIIQNLRRCVYHGDDVSARENMLLGSLLAGIGLADAGVGAAHALGYPLGGLYRVPHGLANAMLIPYVMAFNLPSAEDKFVRVAESMGEVTSHLSSREASEKAVEAVAALAEDVGIPGSLSDLGIPKSDIPTLVEAALKVARPVENNPRTLSPEEAAVIYEAAFED